MENTGVTISGTIDTVVGVVDTSAGDLTLNGGSITITDLKSTEDVSGVAFTVSGAVTITDCPISGSGTSAKVLILTGVAQNIG